MELETKPNRFLGFFWPRLKELCTYYNDHTELEMWHYLYEIPETRSDSTLAGWVMAALQRRKEKGTLMSYGSR